MEKGGFRMKKMHKPMPTPMIEVKAPELARAYVIPQPYTNVLPAEKGLKAGTIFAELIHPYPDKPKKKCC